ncbi:MAG: class I SAM-dependent methyltransferase [Flavobacteriales bacterium]|nr:class I SAM-dependent methyltransferase [Flavobacteriales bacterium]
MNYQPQPYWNEVAREIRDRSGSKVIAGDDSPYYRYKRQRFESMLGAIQFSGKTVLELGPGPGANLRIVQAQSPKRLLACDVSEEMIQLAKANLNGIADKIEFMHIDGKRLPLEDGSVEVAFASTVLQHNTEDAMMESILTDLCRVSGNEVHIFEETNKRKTGTELCMARPVNEYQRICEAAGFELKDVEYININVSYVVCGIINKLFNANSRKEGQPISRLSFALQSLLLPVTRIFDKVFGVRKNLTRMSFRRKTE